MRRDSIFYAIFQRSPSSLFELLADVPEAASQYRFESVAVKEPKFEIDGIFLPPDASTPGVVYTCEVQFQRDHQLYKRIFGELFLYFYRNRQYYSDWQAVVIYPSRQQEQIAIEPYRMLLESNHVHRVYLKELGPIEQLPLGVALMVLTTKIKKQAPAAARQILARSQAADLPLAQRQVIMDMIGTIITYRFNTLSREEIEKMLGITLKETRVYQEAREEERQTIALNMLSKQMALETIAELTGLTLEQLQQLQANQPQN